MKSSNEEKKHERKKIEKNTRETRKSMVDHLQGSGQHVSGHHVFQINSQKYFTSRE